MWLPILGAVGAAAAAVGGFGAWVHHRRFVAYHAYKGKPTDTSFRAWLASEAVGSVTLGWWHVRGFLRDGLRVPVAPRGRPVVCVHGYSQNATNFVGLRAALEADGRPTIGVSMNHRFGPMRWYARRLEQHLERLARQFPDGVDVVAHSMGGIVLRMVLATRADLRDVVRTVVTLGSPHRGTAAARGIPLVPEIRALKRRSALLASLPDLGLLVPHARIVSIAGAIDTVVYPVESSVVPGSEAVVLAGIGHAGLLTDPRSWAAVRGALAERA